MEQPRASFELSQPLPSHKLERLLKNAHIFHRRALYDVLVKRNYEGVKTFVDGIPRDFDPANPPLPEPVPMPEIEVQDTPLVQLLRQRGQF